MKLNWIFFSFLIIFAQGVIAAKVDTVNTHSEAMNKDIKAVVITPDNAGQQALPVLYLLHGYGGNYADWIKKVPALSQNADQYHLIIVCPDGAIGSWYWDSPIDKGFRYETYVATELVNWVDAHYKTRANRSGRAITGLSMGGQGALYLAFRHQDVFGAAGSMSGGVDIRPFPNNWDMAKRLGSYAENPALWESYTVINQIHLLTPNSLVLTFDCGTGDFFYGVNESLHAKLLERNIPHDYSTRPGAHTWEYWSNSITFQLVFFSHFFNQAG
ncbi:S-formylglutathione hydrolase FrmB [bacterium A37T11]|nr:S-formylglutathione hydrolase FrmB [bacterium A37T11]